MFFTRFPPTITGLCLAAPPDCWAARKRLQLEKTIPAVLPATSLKNSLRLGIQAPFLSCQCTTASERPGSGLQPRGCLRLFRLYVADLPVKRLPIGPGRSVEISDGNYLRGDERCSGPKASKCSTPRREGPAEEPRRSGHQQSCHFASCCGRRKITK